jgi:hypothetical protein
MQNQHPTSTMSHPRYIFSLCLRVDDPKALHRAALDHLTNEDGLTERDALELIGPSDAPSITDCIIVCLDPGRINGCSIDDSGAEEA